MHTISFDLERRLIKVKLEGLCSLAELEAFSSELRSAILSFPDGGRSMGTLYDFTGASIQTQEVVLAMRQLAEHPLMVHRRVAMHTAGVLARRQAERICEHRSNMRVFDDQEEAVAWLLAPS